MHGLMDSKILVVEDDPRMCEGIRYLLDFYGFDVQTNGNLLDALNALQAIEYDLVLLDLHLEDECGFAIMDHLVERNLDTQVIVVTGHHSESYVITALKKGATDYLKKPFEPNDLLESVNKALGQQKRQRELCLYKDIVASSSEAIIIGDHNGRIVYTNAAYQKLINMDNAVLNHSSTIQKRPSNSNGVVDEQIRKALESGMPWEGMVDMVNAAGRQFVAWKRVDAIYDADGGVAYGFALLHDITTQVENERAIASSRERYRRVIDSQKDYLCRLNTDFEVTFVNKTYADYWGKKPRAMIGRPYMALIQDSIQHTLFNDLVAVRLGSTPIEIEYKIVDAHGRIRWQQWQFQSILDKNGGMAEIQCVGRDVTRKKMIEAETEEKKEKFRNLAEITSDWIWELDKDGVYTYVSPVVHELLGYRPEEVLGKRPFDFIPEEGTQRYQGVFQEALAGGQPFRNIENISRHKDGSLVTLETSGVPIFDAAGAVIGYRGIDRDISDRKLVEKRLQEESSMLKQALTKVKRLSGMLPICASCKMIRDDKGYWSKIEAYIESHSEAEFSHGICPQCARKLYPELYQEE